MSDQAVSQEYLAKRQLRRGSAGWILLAGLGVAYVISGAFAGWNFGLAVSGWGGFVIASVLACIMYFALVFSLAEMSAAIPAAGGGYSFARQAMGPAGGYLTGFAVLIEYALIPAAIVIFIGSAVEELTGFNGPWLYAFFYALFIGIHLAGVGEALKLMLIISLVAVLVVFVTAFKLFGSFDASLLFNIKPANVAGANSFMPYGWQGVWAALPFAMWLFMAVEGVPLAAEEAKDPARDVPKGIVGAMIVLVLTASLMVLTLAGSAGTDLIGKSTVPLVDALKATNNQDLAVVVNVLGLTGLIASFFSLIYGYSRLVFALSRAGYLPKILSLTNKQKSPTLALVVPGILGFLASLTGEGELIMGMAVAGATISYAFISLSHILLRINRPHMSRPYKTPGGVFTSSLAFLMSLVALTGVYAFDPRAFNAALILFAIGAAYFFLYSRHKLVAKTAEEEIELVTAAVPADGAVSTPQSAVEA